MQALGFVSSHSEVVFGILKERSRALSLASLDEVSLVTGLICRACVGLGDWSAGTGLGSPGSSNAELHGHLTRIQRLMLSLLAHYCLPDSWDKLVSHSVDKAVVVMPSVNIVGDNVKQKKGRRALLEIAKLAGYTLQLSRRDQTCKCEQAFFFFFAN